MTSDEMAKAASKNTITYSKGQRKTLEDARKGKGVIRDAHGFPFKDQAAAKSVTDHQAAERARLDRAMGIKPQAQSITTLNKAEKARLKGVAPARDVSPHATQGRAGSSPEQYRRNQEILIRARKRVREKLAMNRKVQRGKTVSPYEDD